MLQYMLDTNICIFTIKNKPREVCDTFKYHHGQICISSITLMELIYGAEKSANKKKNLDIIEGFSARLEVLTYDVSAAQHSGQLRAELARNGKSIGPYDQMIAGHARSKGLIIVTNNLREFERIPGLRSVDWTPSGDGPME
jgi:tRNA(fMet)-specific endonuclease VapC